MLVKQRALNLRPISNLYLSDMKLSTLFAVAQISTAYSWTLYASFPSSDPLLTGARDRYNAPSCTGEHSVVSSIGAAPRTADCLLGGGQSFYLRDMPSNIMVVSWIGPNCTGTYTQYRSVTHSCYKSVYESLSFGPI